jgi:hypothetical protein
VPSFDHEILIELFRGDGRLAAELLRTCAGYRVDHARVDLGSVDLSQVASTEYRADAVAILRDHENRPVTGVIVEVQRRIDRDKLWTWPVYVATLRAKLCCPAVLLVVAPTPEVAAWARRAIDLGHPRFQLVPIVVDFHDIPRVCDRDAASYLPELAVLSALAHPELEIAEIAIEAIQQFPEERSRLYWDVIMKGLPTNLRQNLEARMLHYEYQTDFARKYYGQGLEEGRLKGQQEGRQEGREQGQGDGLRTAVIALARAKLRTVAPDDLARIAAITDLCLLTELVTALGQARTAFGARAALARALNR